MARTIISFSEGCNLLGYSKATVYSLISKKILPYSQPTKRGRIYFEKEKLESWILSNSYGGNKSNLQLDTGEGVKTC